MPLYMEAPPGPGSATKVTRRGYLDGHIDQITDRSQEKRQTSTRTTTLPPAHEIIEIDSSPPMDRPTIAPRRVQPQSKKQTTSDSDDEPVVVPVKKRAAKKSKEIISASDISGSDADNTLELTVPTKSENTKTTAKALKGKGKATVTKSSATGNAARLGAPPAPSNQLMVKPISAFAAAPHAVAAASRAKPSPSTLNPAGSSRIQPRPIKQQPMAISAPEDPFTMKTSGSKSGGQPQESGKQKGASMRNVAPQTSTVQESTPPPKRSAFGPIRIFDDPALSMSKPAPKRSADNERLSQTVTSKKPRMNVDASTSPGLGMASAPTEEATLVTDPTSSVEDKPVPDATSQPTPPPTQGAGVNPTHGYQWPYGFFPPFSFPPGFPAPPPGWTFPGMPPWNPDRPAGSASDLAAPVPPYPPHPYFPQAAFPTPSAKPAEGEPGPSRLT